MTNWDIFFKEKVQTIFFSNKTVIDIGGGLRIKKEKGNRFDPSRSWALPLVQKVDYKIMDTVKDYNPDIVGDIHVMPFAENSVDAVLCLAVLEHVLNPFKAMEEIYRVLKHGGMALLYVPFLFYYHAMRGYYPDYWRFTIDGVNLLTEKFSQRELCAVRGPFATLVHLSPFGRFKILEKIFIFFDIFFKKNKSCQVSGYYVFLIK